MNTTPTSTEEYLYALSQRNLVYNGDFRYFSNAIPSNCGIPDGWQYYDVGSGGSLVQSGCAVAITTSHDETSTMTFCQAISEFPRWEDALKNQFVTVSVVLDITANAEVSLYIDDGVNRESKSWTANKDDDTSLTLTFQVAEAATKLETGIRCTANAAKITVRSFFANKGLVAIDSLPTMVSGVIGEQKQYIATQNAPAEELSMCAAAMELTEQQTRLDSVLNGRFGRGQNQRSLLPRVSGYFMRAWDNGANVDPNADQRTTLTTQSVPKGDSVGSAQGDELISHKHGIAYSPDELTPSGNTKPITPITDLKAGSTEEFGGQETRPKNIYCLYTIKWA